MHIGLNLIFLTPGESGGMEIYARELIPELVAAAPEYRFTAFVNRDAAGSGGPWDELPGTVVVPVSARNRVQWVRGEQQLLPPLAFRAGVDLLHSLASTAPAWGRFRRVTTVHDLIYRVAPQAHSGVRSLGMRVLVPLAARRSHRVLVDASSTRADLERYLRVPPAKIDVVPLGFGLSRRAEPLPASEVRTWLHSGERPVLLTVSAKLVHKNLRRLLDALADIPPPRRPLLVLPGYPTPHEQELRAHAESLGVGGDVRFLGWVSPEQLEGLYGVATCFVFPSLIEGFGLPVLEAMARGVPVACSQGGALAEVAGSAALTFDPESTSAIAGAIERLLNDRAEAARLATRGRERAGQFRWSTTARLTLDSYQRALGAP